MSKHSVTIRGLRVVTTCWSWAWSNRTFPSKWVGLGSPLAASSVYGDLTCSVHTVNNLCMFKCQWHFYLCNRGPYVRLTFVPNMLCSWNKDIIIIKSKTAIRLKHSFIWQNWFMFLGYCKRHIRNTMLWYKVKYCGNNHVTQTKWYFIYSGHVLRVSWWNKFLINTIVWYSWCCLVFWHGFYVLKWWFMFLC